MKENFKDSHKHIPRAENSEVDELTKAAANNLPMLKGTFCQEIVAPATIGLQREFREVLLIGSEDWRQAIINQINGEYQLNDEASIAKMAARARNYTVIDGALYKKGFVEPLLECITQAKGNSLPHETHSGFCGAHIGPRALSMKALREGFYCQHISKTQRT